MSNDNLQAALLKILELQQQRNENLSEGNFLIPNAEQGIEQILLRTILNPVQLEKRGKYLTTRDGGEMPLMEVFDGAIINERGVIEKSHKEIFYTMDDGTSLGGYAECMNCGKIVVNENIFRCRCGKTCCVLCGTYSSATNKYYCCGWHKFLG